MRVILKTCWNYLRSHPSNNFTMIGNTSTRMASSSSKVMIVGLGNYDMPGTRHNVGMMVADSISDLLGMPWVKNKPMSAFVAHNALPSIEILLLKSKLAMNISGKSVSKAASQYDIPLENIYIIVDNMDKSLGKYGIKEGGSAKGHNGVKSCMSSLRSDVMPSLRIGIGRPSVRSEDPLGDHVLGKFTSTERTTIRESMDDMIKLLFKHIKKRTGVDIIDEAIQQESIR